MKIIPHYILKSFSYSNFELMFNFKNYFTLFAFYDVISYTFIYITLEISPEYSLEGLMLSWNSNPLATWCEELTHWKRPWCWERLKSGGEGDDRGWDGWMVSLTQWTWVWVNSGSWWWTARFGVLQSMGWQSQTQLSDLIINWSIHFKCMYNWTKSQHYCYKIKTAPPWVFLFRGPKELWCSRTQRLGFQHWVTGFDLGQVDFPSGFQFPHLKNVGVGFSPLHYVVLEVGGLYNWHSNLHRLVTHFGMSFQCCSWELV